MQAGEVGRLDCWPEALIVSLRRSRSVGAIGPGLLQDHLAHAAGFARVAEEVAGGPPATVLDLGSGGGLPGLVLAHLWPRTEFVLLDAIRKRTDVLEAAVALCGWQGRVTVMRQRAELAGRSPGLRGAMAMVVARSFATPPVVAECGAPFLQTGGRLVVSEPPTKVLEPERERWPAAPLWELGLSRERSVEEPQRFQILRQAAPCPDRFPRRAGVPAKHPLY